MCKIFIFFLLRFVKNYISWDRIFKYELKRYVLRILVEIIVIIIVIELYFVNDGICGEKEKIILIMCYYEIKYYMKEFKVMVLVIC